MTGTEQEMKPKDAGHVEMIATGKLIPTEENPREIDRKAPEFMELVESIRAEGVVVPLIVRKHPSGAGYEVRAGQRRLEAAITAGLAEVPCIVRDLDDQAAFEVTYTENTHREGLTALEEGRAVATLLAYHKGDVAAVCKAMGRKPTWVAQRAAIEKRLIAPWKKFASSREMRGQITAVHLELLAKLPEPLQAKFLDTAAGSKWNSWRERMPTTEHLADDIQREMRLLSEAPWTLADGTLLPRTPACSECKKRTSVEPLLWDSRKAKDDRCLDAACYAAKRLAWIARKVEEARFKEERLLLVHAEYSLDNKLKEALKGPFARYFDVEKGKKGDENSQLAIYVDGARAGQTLWVKPAKRGAISTALPLSEKRKRLDKKRWIEVEKRVRKLVKESEWEKIKRPDGLAKDTYLIGLAAYYGATSLARPGFYSHYGCGGDAEALRKSFLGQTRGREVAFHDTLWELVRDNIGSLMHIEAYETEVSARQKGEIRLAAHIIGADADAMFKTITKEPKFATPAAWERRAGGEKTRTAKKAKTKRMKAKNGTVSTDQSAADSPQICERCGRAPKVDLAVCASCKKELDEQVAARKARCQAQAKGEEIGCSA